jgi:hypothetical protein
MIARGDHSTALKYLLPCLKSAYELQIVRDGLEEALLGIAEVAVSQGIFPQAVELFEFLLHNPDVAQHVRDQAAARRAMLGKRPKTEEYGGGTTTLDALVHNILSSYPQPLFE